MALRGTADAAPGATKPLFVPLTSINNITGQFSFTEFQIPPGSGESYFFFISSIDGSQGLILSLDDSGNVLLQVGPTILAPSYMGAWSPNNGSHKVHFSVDPAGVPILFIDGISIPLVLTAFGPSIISSLPTNSVAILNFIFTGTGITSSYRNAFIASGVIGPDAVFCCP